MKELLKLAATLPIDQVKAISIDLTKYSEAAQMLQEQADRAKIVDAETYGKGGDLIKIARTQKTSADELRTKLSGPFHKVWKFINESFKPTAGEFDAVISTITAKMMTWKREEDKRLRIEAEKVARKLEEEALARAALEKTEEAQDEVLDAAGEAGEEIVKEAGVGLTRGSFGSSTGTRKVYTTNVVNLQEFLGVIVRTGFLSGVDMDIGELVDLRKGGLNKLAEAMNRKGVGEIRGANFTATDKIAVY